ncbi:MAG: PTS sugar transporter subunit IIA [Verrucomicrobia bacterium]|nr:PTS sugar transporter subunit IIA [Verrucomicrobiota bacterium]
MTTEPSASETALVSLAEYTGPELIVPRLSGSDRTAAIKELSQRLEHAGRIRDMLAFYHATLNQEFFQNSATEEGSAFPHARMANLPQLSFAFGRADTPLPWGPKGAQPVRLVFLLAVPETATTEHLNLMSGFGRLHREPRLLARLRAATDTFEMLRVLTEVRWRVHPPTPA